MPIFSNRLDKLLFSWDPDETITTKDTIALRIDLEGDGKSRVHEVAISLLWQNLPALNSEETKLIKATEVVILIQQNNAVKSHWLKTKDANKFWKLLQKTTV